MINSTATKWKVFYRNNKIGRLYLMFEGERPMFTPLLSEATRFPVDYFSYDLLSYEEEYLV